MSRGSKSKNRGLPKWYVGKLIRDDIDGFWYGEREGKLFKQRDILVSKHNLDFITDEQREKSIARRLKR